MSESNSSVLWGRLTSYNAARCNGEKTACRSFSKMSSQCRQLLKALSKGRDKGTCPLANVSYHRYSRVGVYAFSSVGPRAQCPGFSSHTHRLCDGGATRRFQLPGVFFHLHVVNGLQMLFHHRHLQHGVQRGACVVSPLRGGGKVTGTGLVHPCPSAPVRCERATARRERPSF